MELTWVYGRTDPPRKKAGITGLYKAVPELLSSLRNQGQGMPTGLPHKEDREPSPAHTPLFCRIGIFGADFYSGKSMTIVHDERRRIDSLHLAAAWPSKDTHAFVPDDHLHPASLHSRYFTVRESEKAVCWEALDSGESSLGRQPRPDCILLGGSELPNPPVAFTA